MKHKIILVDYVDSDHLAKILDKHAEHGVFVIQVLTAKPVKHSIQLANPKQQNKFTAEILVFSNSIPNVEKPV